VQHQIIYYAKENSALFLHRISHLQLRDVLARVTLSIDHVVLYLRNVLHTIGLHTGQCALSVTERKKYIVVKSRWESGSDSSADYHLPASS
jgi:hypothetical protein